MRRLRYSVAMSLDGFIAGPNGEYDWIMPDSGIDFAALWNQFDTLLMGRRTFEVAIARFPNFDGMGKKTFVVSTTLDPARHPGVNLLSRNILPQVAELKAAPGRDIWLMGGGVLCRFLLDAGLVDTVEVSVMPVLLGSGIPLVQGGRRWLLHRDECKPLPSGIVTLLYSVVPQPPAR